MYTMEEASKMLGVYPNTYEQELVEDMLSIITVFSSRLYGSRSHKRKRLQQTVKQAIEDNEHAYVQ
ncbi:hypothetical protein [Virgibacillus doumboii]|uniref:hypothetical protein n=1 Tax=Virgibacillus doumboii TaxID=2697503 RepID=UPI0013DE8124|nr:hypothetical protein [Virgibacillus doumboii]